MRACKINKLEYPLIPPPSDRSISKPHLSISIVHIPRVNKVFLVHGLSPLDAPDLGVVWSDSCSVSIVAADEYEFVPEAGPCTSVPVSRNRPEGLTFC